MENLLSSGLALTRPSLYIALVITFVDSDWTRAYTRAMLASRQLLSIRRKLGLSQEQMARLLSVSFASVNRWEGRHSSPTGPILDLYLALDAALRAGNPAATIMRAADNQRSAFLYTLFSMAYASSRRSR
jgi:DNA-binding transcriptional regulator YiaG